MIVLLDDDTVGTIVTAKEINEGDLVTVTLTAENGHEIEKTGPVADILSVFCWYDKEIQTYGML